MKEQYMWLILILSHNRITVDDSKDLPRAVNNRWVQFEAVRASNDWKPNGMIFYVFREEIWLVEAKQADLCWR
jgi:hypothetical protein